jgi:predicted ATPase
MPHRVLNVSEHGMLDVYESQLKARGYQSDPAQRAAAQRLQALYTDLVGFKAARRGRIRRIFSRPTMPRSVYFWGGVGRGKSFLMDCFYDAVPYALSRQRFSRANTRVAAKRQACRREIIIGNGVERRWEGAPVDYSRGQVKEVSRNCAG